MSGEPDPARRVGPRAAALALLVAAWLGSVVMVPPAALALHRVDGDDPGPQISRLHALFLFGVIPVSAGLLIALLVSLPSLARGPRYRPGLGWEGTPEWYGAPEGQLPAQVGSDGYGVPQVARHRRSEALTGRIVATGDTGESADGGSSARW